MCIRDRLELVGEGLGGAHAIGERLLGHLRPAGASLGQDGGIDDGAVVIFGSVGLRQLSHGG